MSAPVSPLPLSLTTHTAFWLHSHTLARPVPPPSTLSINMEILDATSTWECSWILFLAYLKKVSHIRVGKIRRDVQMEVELSETDVINIIYLLFQKTLSKCI